MRRREPAADRRVAALLRCYPSAWRDRYGEEFAELLAAEFEAQPRSLRRTADVVRAGLAQRGSALGIAAGPLTQPESALAAAGGALAVVGLLGLSLWTQLAFGVHAAPSGHRTAIVGVVIFPLTACYLVLLTVAALAPLAVAAAGRLRRVAAPITVAAAGLGALIIGGYRFAPARPGAGGVAAYGWAETLGISTYWVHPTRILELRPDLVGWMGLSMVAFAAMAGGAMTTVRRLELTPVALRYETRLAQLAVIGVLPALFVSAGWVLSSQTSWDADLRAGSLDLVLLAVMAIALAVAVSSTRSVGRAADLR